MIVYNWQPSSSTKPCSRIQATGGRSPTHPNASTTDTGQTLYISKSRVKHAALDFLSNIPVGVAQPKDHEGMGDAVEQDHERADPNADTLASLEPHTDTTPDPSKVTQAIGIRVKGDDAYSYVCKRSNNQEDSERFPNRYMTADEKEQWEHNLINRGIHNKARNFLSWDKGYPTMAFSVTMYDGQDDSKKRKTLRLSSVVLELPRRRNDNLVLPGAAWVTRRAGTSYARYINPDWATLSGDKPWTPDEDEWDTKYRPNVLDNPKIRQGKHRVVNALTGYSFSLIPYTKAKDLKREWNEVFREQHPDLPPGMTLSKIRNLKKEAFRYAKTLDIELSTVALAIVYFEKLCLKGIVTKPNRKLIMSVCMVLAFKFNQESAAKLQALLDEIEKIQMLKAKQIVKAEFSVFAHLNFHLNVTDKQWLAHFNQSLKAIEKTPAEYLGDQLPDAYLSSSLSSSSSSSSSSSDSE